ncbi:hypothetical protein JHN63_02025 [Streptomyces sp. MBT65]|uniref:hypothetical protein n=1 Tax=Streptomyces sp. MBT65 TaxID=1488395 RepID=UPI00190B4807|nr:hypothetical protein [Streptomyces sp. MBT65]MBK3572619.1 hypothetical protein [Streptomyces sp. MBT65]
MERTQTDPTDEALRRLIEQPSYAAQVLIVMARMLEMDGTQPVGPVAQRRALDIATDTVLGTLPEVVRRDSLERAHRVMPDLSAGTRGETALRLRAAAKNLG